MEKTPYRGKLDFELVAIDGVSFFRSGKGGIG